MLLSQEGLTQACGVDHAPGDCASLMAIGPETRYCPVCGADWQASEIPAKSRQYYAPSATHYSRLISIETRSYDGVSYWQCPDCKATWDRWTSALTARQFHPSKGLT